MSSNQKKVQPIETDPEMTQKIELVHKDGKIHVQEGRGKHEYNEQNGSYENIPN